MGRYQFTADEETMLDRLPISLAVYQWLDEKVTTVFVSQSFVQYMGFRDKAEARHVMDTDMYRDTHPDDVARVADLAVKFAARDGGFYNAVYRNKTSQQKTYHLIHGVGKHVWMPDGTRLTFVFYFDETEVLEQDCSVSEENLTENLTGSVEKENKLRHNQYDDLTGLPRMGYFLQLAGTWNRDIKAKGGKPVLLAFDISGFKLYNHHYSVTEGDRLLRALGLLLRKYFGAEHSARLGEDHFGAVTDLQGLTGKLEAMFGEWKELHHGSILPLRVGIYEDAFGKASASLAFDRAKTACDSVRNLDQSRYAFFNEKMLEETSRNEYVLHHFADALQYGWIRLYLQPIVRASDGSLCHQEALARWQDPQKGLLPPADFIPVLEREGLLYKLDLAMVDRAAAYLKMQLNAGKNPVPLSVNLSEKDFLACNMVGEVCSRLDEVGVSRDKLVIEITEHAIGKEPELLQKVIGDFHAAGFSVWLDDFGSESSSLNILQNFSFELIKLDMQFLRAGGFSAKSRIIIQTVIELAHRLQVETVVEGVENKAQVDFLRAAGCDRLQGYYFGRPEPAKV